MAGLPDARRSYAALALTALARTRSPMSPTPSPAPRLWPRPSRYRIVLGLMLAPYLLGVTALVGLPGLITLTIAFTSYDALTPPVWAGLRNFGAVFADRLFWVAAGNSLLFVALSVPLRLLGALALALLLNQPRPGFGVYRAAVYLPTVVPDVAYALIWLWLLNPLYGPLNLILGALGLPAPAWLADPRTALPALVLMSLFQIGEGVVVLLAALQDVPEEYYQAAALDGAGRWQRFHTITLPLIGPWLLLLTLRDIILNAQSSFVPTLLMTGGDPDYATLMLPLLIYTRAFERFRFGEGATMLLLLLALVGLLLWLVYVLVGGWGHGDEV